MQRLSAVLLASFALFVVAPAAPASAHALLRTSEPADGARVETAPSLVTLVFTEQPEPGLASVQVLDPSGGSVERGPPEPVAGNPLSLRVPLKPLPEGAYTVAWRVVSRVDGHVTAGAVAFGVGVAPKDVASTGVGRVLQAPPPSPLEVVGRVAFLAGLVALLGAGVVGAVAFRGLPAGVRPVVAGAWATSMLAVLALFETQRKAAGSAVGDFLATYLGRALLARAG
ncbi:MAG: copper resistance protein CopC, partial [Actinomycetota bacterium]|nr:copper resistance protein CopC [Actinomycetota bacterium]